MKLRGAASEIMSIFYGVKDKNGLKGQIFLLTIGDAGSIFFLNKDIETKKKIKKVLDKISSLHYIRGVKMRKESLVGGPR
ncbi:MAG: hypothetical protein ACE5OR_06180 [bacterium]